MADMQMLFLSLIYYCCLSSVLSHSWLTCPPSFNTNPTRGGHLSSLCEPNINRAPITTVTAGDRLKVGWTSNNHGGGFVRISLVPIGEHQSEEVAKANVLKYACYGHHIDNTRFGDCVHPCGGRGGCDFQRTVDDIERFDTTIGIPTNLREGEYVLQTAMLLGNGGSPYFSCARMRILGGNPTLNCQSNEDPIVYPCYKAPGGRTLESSNLLTGARRGNFCFHSNRRGTVDDDIDIPPVNIDCDPRLTCKNSVNQGICGAAPFMRDIIDESSHPKQPRCLGQGLQRRRGGPRPDSGRREEQRNQNNEQNNNRRNRQQNIQQEQPTTTTTTATTTAQPTTTTSSSSAAARETTTTTTTTTTTARPPQNSNNNNNNNNNNNSNNNNNIARRRTTRRRRREFLNPIFSFYRPVKQISTIRKNSGEFAYEIHLTRPIPRGSCWQLDLQFRLPLRLVRGDYNIYQDGMLVHRSNRRTLTIEKRTGLSQDGINNKKKIVVKYTAYREGREGWTNENMQYITAMLLVLPQSQCFNTLLRSN